MPAVAPTATVSRDHVLGGRVAVTQPRQGYRIAIDPVVLAAACAARPTDRVLDLGSGVGAAALCLAFRVVGVIVDGLEFQAPLVALAQDNALANGLADRLRFVVGDAAAPPPEWAGRFDRVITNPPYLKPGAHTPPPDPGRALAHGETAVDLSGWIRAAAFCLRPRGTVTIVHRADRIDDLIAALHPRFGAIGVLPLWPKPGVAAKRVVVSGRLGARSPARLLPGLVLHQEDGSFTDAARGVLVDAGALSL